MHVGIILDGNRRYAKKLLWQPWKGHEEGAQNVKKLILSWAPAERVDELTLYVLSLQNLERPKIELDFLYGLLEEWLVWVLDSPEVKDQQVCVRVRGRVQKLPESIQILLTKVTKSTQQHQGLIVNLCLAYGGREEIVDTVNALIGQGRQEILMQDISGMLTGEPDLIIRTGNAQRTSNFLMWQSWYSEWLFVQKMWPEFDGHDLHRAIEDYKSRDRRYGK